MYYVEDYVMEGRSAVDPAKVTALSDSDLMIG
jgi:hypothetical protein